jgi:hypothetical protein
MTSDLPLFYLALLVTVLAVLGILCPTAREFVGLSNRTDAVYVILDHSWDDRALALFKLKRAASHLAPAAFWAAGRIR